LHPFPASIDFEVAESSCPSLLWGDGQLGTELQGQECDENHRFRRTDRRHVDGIPVDPTTCGAFADNAKITGVIL
jgi:hypothetical protein